MTSPLVGKELVLRSDLGLPINQISLVLLENLFVTWAQGFSTQTVVEDLFFWSSPNFGPKSALNLSKDLFFGLHLILGRKTV